MYAIIETGAKQYRVEEGDVIDVELLGQSQGSAVEFNNVLLFKDGKQTQLGKPHLKDCIVQGEILEEELSGPKVVNFKYKKRKNYRRKVGHRQKYSRVKIKAIKG